MDCANFYGVAVPDTKKGQALYPAMGRAHINFLGENKLIFNAPPRFIFRSINYVYIVVENQVIRIDKSFQEQLITSAGLELDDTAKIFFAFLPVGSFVYCMFTDGKFMYIVTENKDGSFTWKRASGTGVTGVITSPSAVGVFGNRFVVTNNDDTQMYLSQVNLGATPTDETSWFNIPGIGSLSASASGVISQFGVLHNQLYVFTDFTTDIWANIPTQIVVAGVTRIFPFKLNTSYNWDYGIADPMSLDIDFGMMVFLARNKNGLVTFMMSDGQQPQAISTQAINVLLERSTSMGLSPFLNENASGFLYQWENTVFYRVAAGKFLDFGDLDIVDSANALEYNFETKTWARVIELNGERNRIQDHVFFNNRHLVTVEDDTAIYEMAGDLYYNELRNPNQPSAQAANSFLKFPMRYELVTKQIFQPDYSEFITDYVEIDFVFGDQTFYKNTTPFLNAVFVVSEDSTPENPIYVVTEDSTEGSETFIITEDSNTPQFDDNHYYDLFKPHIELYWSDDGGITFESADLREFSPLGAYQWRMRWYQLGASRNRVYKLICVSSAPIVVLGGVQNVRRASGGAN